MVGEVAAAAIRRPRILTESVTIAGPAGPLEAVVESVSRDVDSIAVVCHPHPQHQGTMHNKVTHTLARWFARRGAMAVRFNFRGVGNSAGTYADGDGETDDALAVIDWGQARRPSLPLFLAGFSFGSMVAIRAAAVRETAALVTVAPAIRFFEAGFVRPDAPWLVIQGLDDDVVAAAAVRDWCNGIEPMPALHAVNGTGHFFHGALGEIDSALDAFLGDSVPLSRFRNKPAAAC